MYYSSEILWLVAELSIVSLVFSISEITCVRFG